MTDGPAAAPIPPAATEGGLSPAAYARIYEAEQPHLVAYARSLTGNAWLADDLVAEAHFRVWRRLATGHDIDNVAAYLTTTVRNLAASAGRGAARETPLDPHAGLEPMQVSSDAYGSGAYGDQDPAARASSVDLLSQVLGQLPKRWVKALWLSEAEGQPLEAVGRGIGAGSGATAVLLHRAREGMRQAFLRAHPGTPDDPACESHWDRMPAHVRGSASARQSEKLLAHVDDCDDCRARLAFLLRANDRLPALVGPALLIFVLGGAGKFLAPVMAGATGAAAGGHGTGSGLLHGVRHALTGGAKAQGAVAGVLGVSVAGAAVAAGLMLTGNDDTVPPQRSAAVQSETPGGRDDAPSASSPSQPSSSRPSTSASRAPVAPQDRSQRTAEPGPEAAPKGSGDADEPAAPKAPAEPQDTETATPTTPPDPPAAERAAPKEAPPTEQRPESPTPTPSPSTDAPTPTPPSEPTTPTSPAPTAPEPTEPSEPTTPPEPSTPAPPEPSAPAPTCTRWLGPIYICHTG
ncbi:sigma factor [Streptomyces sp. BH055]|uniref:sigma factor n=1 Tax=unclassified Streptomyces TaxID=2593676 RepID=UPI003BB70F5B